MRIFVLKEMKADEETFTIDELDNAVDSLETACSFLGRHDPLKWKWVAFAVHHSLYSFCITCLEMGNVDQVLSIGGRDDEGNLCQIGNSPYMRSTRVPVNGGPAYRIKWEPTQEQERFSEQKAQEALTEDSAERMRRQERKHLIGFWTALARVQDPIFWMARLFISKALMLTDEEIRHLVWLHEPLRNDLMHFKPTTYIVLISNVKTAVLTALKAIEFLALDSRTFVWPLEGNHRERIELMIREMRMRLNNQQ